MNATGKSSMTVQFVDGHFVDSYYPTIENTFSKMIRWKNQDFATEIIDTAGQVRATASKNDARKVLPEDFFSLPAFELRPHFSLMLRSCRNSLTRNVFLRNRPSSFRVRG
jgi:GTPase SAR1 family protein